MTSQTPHDTYPEVVINRTKFDARSPSSLKVKANVRTHKRIDRTLLHLLDATSG